jgi:hypothetical protein
MSDFNACVSDKQGLRRQENDAIDLTCSVFPRTLQQDLEVRN